MRSRSLPLIDCNSAPNSLSLSQAHKAKGKFSYCEVIKAIHAVHKKFRVVALSATPGKTNDVIEIVQNLLISKIEIRSESSPDVAKYTFKKEIVREKVRLGYLEEIKNEFTEILAPYLKKLVELKAISGGNFSKGWIIVQQKKFASESHPNRSEVMSHFAIVISFMHSLELLERHGIFMFLESLKDETNVTKRKYFVNQDRQLKNFLDTLDEKYASRNPLSLNINPLPNGTIPAIDANIDFGHPKFEVLKQKLLEFLDAGGNKTIIFCEYRDTVKLIFIMLLQLRPKVQPRMLIGQGGTVSQKDQIAVMKDFCSNKVNVLITTSVCEEGIDVGDVDLVICFDMNSKNTTRFVQRIGRTGRKRNGKVLMLVTEGKEEEALMSVIETKKKLNKSIASSNLVKDALYKASPRLIPLYCLPRCIETKMNIPEKQEVVEETKKPTKKSKKTKSAGTASIASHFRKLTVPKDEEMEIEAATETVPKISDAIDENFNQIKHEFDLKFTEIVSKISKHDDMLISNLNWRRDQDLIVFEKMKKMFSEPTIDTADIPELNFDILNTSLPPWEGMESCDVVSSLTDSVNFSKNPFYVCESRYPSQLNHQELPDAYAQFKQPQSTPTTTGLTSNVKLRTSTPSHPSTSTPLTSRTKKRSSVVVAGESPLLKAFEKQREMSKISPSATTPRCVAHPTTIINTSNSHAFPREIETNDFAGSAVIASSISSTATKNDVTVSTNGSVRPRSRQQRKEKTLFEFFNLKSIDDIFAGIDSDSVEQEQEDNTPDIIPSSQPSERMTNVEVELFGEEIEEDNYLMQIPEITGSNHSNVNAVASAAPKPSQSECTTPSSSHARKTRKRKNPNFELDFNIDEMFGNASGDHSSQKENSPNNHVSSTKAAGVEAEAIEITSPTCSPQKRMKPNFAKLTNALRTPNFLAMLNEADNNADRNDISTVKVSRVDSSLPHCSKVLESPRNRTVKDSTVINNSDNESSTFVSPVVRKAKNRKRLRRDFLDTQAAVDGTDTEDEDEIDESMVDFVVDESLLENEDRVDMQARYLESLRSPSARQNGIFKMPRRPAMFNNVNVFSQDPNLDMVDDDDDDEMDSFIVSNSQVEEHNETLDELEIAERILKEKRKNARLAKKGIKRRKIIRIDDGSSDEDDELQQLRRQLENNPD